MQDAKQNISKLNLAMYKKNKIMTKLGHSRNLFVLEFKICEAKILHYLKYSKIKRQKKIC